MSDWLGAALTARLDGQVDMTVDVVGVRERGPTGRRATIVRLVDPPVSAQAAVARQ